MTQEEVRHRLTKNLKWLKNIVSKDIWEYKHTILSIGDERNPKFYVDISQKQIDQKGYEASEELREKKIPENLEPGNTFNYEVDWTALVGSKYDFCCLYNIMITYR